MRIGIVGSGLQCRRRIESLADSVDDEVILVAGINHESLDLVSTKYAIQTTQNVEDIFLDKGIDAVIVCTPPSSHLKYIAMALEQDKKILVEKPISQTSEELVLLRDRFGVTLNRNLRCGFNHRFHPGIQKMKELLNLGLIGSPIFARAVYGICARDDYPKEWRANPSFAAGGQFMEQGSHLIDLFSWLVGPPVSIYCKTSNLIFENQPLDDGGMAILGFENGVTAQMHTTLGQWHNKFEFEIFGDSGFLKVEGLGNTYGTEKLMHGKRDQSAPFNQEVFEFRGIDRSWRAEWESFKRSFESETEDIAKFEDGLFTMQVAEAGYRSSKTGSEIRI
jgi:predicted dehydrogenase